MSPPENEQGSVPTLAIQLRCAPFSLDAAQRLVQDAERLASGPFDEAMDDRGHISDRGARPWRREVLAKALKRRRVSLTLVRRGDERTCVELTLLRDAHGSFVEFLMTSPSLPGAWPLLAARARAWAIGLPGVTSGSVGDPAANKVIVRAHRAMGLGGPPPCFGLNLRWRHYLAPSLSGLFLAPEDVAAAPALAETLENGLVELTFFEDPLAWDHAEARERVFAATHWLRARDRFGRPAEGGVTSP